MPGAAAAKYNTMKKVESALYKSLAHCAALSLQRSDEAPPSSQQELENQEPVCDRSGYLFKVLPQQQSVGIAMAIVDVLTTVAVRHTWRPAIRINSVAETETNRDIYRRMIGKLDSAWARALLSNGVSDATRAVARQRLLNLKAKAVEPHTWSLRAACQAAENGWMSSCSERIARKPEHRRLVAVKLEHMCARNQWTDALAYAAEADPSQLPGLYVMSRQVFKGVDSLISRSTRPACGWPDEKGTVETLKTTLSIRDGNEARETSPVQLFEQAERLRAAPGSDLAAATAVAALPELKQSPLCGLLLALSSISTTPLLPHLNSVDFTRQYQKMGRLAIECILNNGRDDVASDTDATAPAVGNNSVLSSAEQARRRRKGKDSAETMWFDKLATDIVSDDGTLPPIGLGSGCSNRFRDLIGALRRDMSDSQSSSETDDKEKPATTDDHLQWCGEMAIELVVAACLRALWQPMLCADRGENQTVHQSSMSPAAATHAAVSGDSVHQTGQPPADEEFFWSTLLDLHDGGVEPATFGVARQHQQQPSQPALLSAQSKASTWECDPWHTGMCPGQKNTYPRGRLPVLSAAPLAALRALAETALQCGDPRSSVHLLKPLLWSCADLGAAAIEACCNNAAVLGLTPEKAKIADEEAKVELKRCIHFVLCDLLPQVGPAAFSRETMLPPYYAPWSCSDASSEGRAIWPPAPTPNRDDNGNIRVEMPWSVFAKREWRNLVTLHSLGLLSVQLLQEAASESETTLAVAMETAAASHIDDCTAAKYTMYAAAARNASATKSAFLSADKKHVPPELAVLRKIVPKSDCVPSSFPTGQVVSVFISGGDSRLSPAHEQLVSHLADTCVPLLIARSRANAKHNNDGAERETNARPTLELDLARRIALSYFYTNPSPQAVQLLHTLWTAADATGDGFAAMTWVAMQQHLAQQLASYTLPRVNFKVLQTNASSLLEDHTYCNR